MALLSLLVPVYNEERFLAEVVQRILAAPLPDGMTREVIIVDDASTDQTPHVLEQLAAAHAEVKALRQEVNSGKGAAVQRAIAAMSGDYAIIQDADLEYDPNDYPVLLAPLLAGEADVVYGSRFTTRPVRRVLSYYHRLVNQFLTWFSNVFTGLDLTDMETCYKAFRGDLLRSLPLHSRRFGIEPEITAKIARRGVAICEVPIRYQGRCYREGKKISWRDGVAALAIIVRYAFRD